MEAPLLGIRDLTVEFGAGSGAIRAVDQVSLDIELGETVALVGESGCGKSATALSIARLLPVPPARYVSGQILIQGRDVLAMGRDELRAIRGRIVSYVFQDPAASLNPVYRIGHQIKESLRLHRPAAAHDAEVVRLLKLVGIAAAEERIRDYPHQLSGGMQQRVMIAVALASEPRLLVADEPTTALDVTIQAQILDLLRDLKKHTNMSLLLITHNLGVVSEIADRIAVMYAGQIVETAPTDPLLRRPHHPYTRALLNSVPQLGRDQARLAAIPGQVPQLGCFPSGCRYHPRCSVAQADCSVQEPDLSDVETGRRVRCPFWSL